MCYFYVKLILIDICIYIDVKALLPNGLLTDPLAGAVAKAYNARTSKVVVAPSGSKVTILLFMLISDVIISFIPINKFDL